jgi:hypothetical protein
VTLKGDWGIRVSNSIAGEFVQTAISFGLTLPSAPTAHYIPTGGPTPAGCEGSVANPGADPGNLCVFEAATTNISAAVTFDEATGTDGQADPWGAGIRGTATNGSSGTPADTRIRGDWAVTAP